MGKLTMGTKSKALTFKALSGEAKMCSKGYFNQR